MGVEVDTGVAATVKVVGVMVGEAMEGVEMAAGVKGVVEREEEVAWAPDKLDQWQRMHCTLAWTFVTGGR